MIGKASGTGESLPGLAQCVSVKRVQCIGVSPATPQHKLCKVMPGDTGAF